MAGSTVRETTEQAVRQLEGLLSVFDGFEGVVYVADMETYEILYANRYVKEKWGDPVGKICWQALHEGQKHACPFCTNSRLLDSRGNPAGSIVWEFENTKTGRWYQCTDRAILWPEGKYVRMEVAVDITERRRAEEKLRKSEEKYRSIIENAVEGIFQATPEGKYLSVNPAFARMCGYQNPEEMVAAITSIQRQLYVNPEDRSKIQALYEEAGVVRNFETELKRKDGQGIWVSVNARTVRDEQGRTLFYEGTIEDITERKRAEEKLRESEQKYRDFFQTSRDCVFISSVAGEWIDFNDAAMELFGYENRAELMKTRIADLYEDPAQRKELTQQIQKLGFVKDYAVNLRKRGGSIIRALITAAVWKDEKGNTVHLQGTIKDLTEQRKLEARLQHTHKMEAIGTLAGGIAHDFNNMLGMILGFTEIALLDLPQGSRSYTSLHKALGATHRAKDLVRQIVAFSRPVDQKRKLIDITPVIHESLKFIRASLPTTIEIRENITCRGAILGDPSEIEQVIMNLCANAYHAMRGQVGLLDISLRDIDLKTIQTFDYKDLSPGKYVRLTVSDTGCGIDPAIRDRIFDPYFTTKPIGEGSGLGLSIVHGIVTNCGGSIMVDSKPGQGATFDIYLPAVARESSESGPEASQAAPTGSGTVLYVDDEAALVEVGKLMLELLGYRVVATTNSMEALKMFMDRPDELDAVVTDMTMPNMTGVELARKVMEVRPEIPIILCTGYSDLINKEKAKELGIRGFLMKPFNLLGLGTIMKNVLGANVQ